MIAAFHWSVSHMARSEHAWRTCASAVLSRTKRGAHINHLRLRCARNSLADDQAYCLCHSKRLAIFDAQFHYIRCHYDSHWRKRWNVLIAQALN